MSKFEPVAGATPQGRKLEPGETVQVYEDPSPWTRETPSSSGWYWLGKHGEPPRVVMVAGLPSGYFGVIQCGRSGESNLDDYRAEDGWRWSGPLSISRVPR